MTKGDQPKEYFTRHGEGSEHPIPQEKFNEKMAQLYTKPDDDWLSEEEIRQEELKKVVQADALRAYGFVRRQIERLRLSVLRIIGLKQKIRGKKARIQGISILVTSLLVVGLSVFAVINRQNLTNEKDVLSEINQQNSEFTTLNPPQDSGETTKQFDQERQIASYKHELAGSDITVTQQLMPEDIKSSPDGIAKLALSLRDKSTISQLVTHKGPIYIATAQGGKQTVIFGYQDLLIFMTSLTEISDEQWAAYINSLQ